MGNDMSDRDSLVSACRQFIIAVCVGIRKSHSYSACERLFSQVNEIKTKKRNILVTKTVHGNILAQQSIHRNRICVDFIPTKDMMEKITSSIYDQEVELLED